MAEVELVEFKEAWLPAVMELEQELFPEDAWTEEMFRSELVGPGRHYWVAAAADELVGYAGVMLLPPEADIQTMAVSPGWQRRGIGSRLLRQCLTTAGDAGCTEVYLEVHTENAPAIELYTRHGFVEVARRPNYYGLGRDAIVMKLDLVSGGHD